MIDAARIKELTENVGLTPEYLNGLIEVLDDYERLREENEELRKSEEAAYQLMMKEQARAQKAEAELVALRREAERARPLIEAVREAGMEFSGQEISWAIRSAEAILRAALARKEKAND